MPPVPLLPKDFKVRVRILREPGRSINVSNNKLIELVRLSRPVRSDVHYLLLPRLPPLLAASDMGEDDRYFWLDAPPRLAVAAARTDASAAGGAPENHGRHQERQDGATACWR